MNDFAEIQPAVECALAMKATFYDSPSVPSLAAAEAAGSSITETPPEVASPPLAKVV